MKEALRMFGAGMITPARKFTKNARLGKYVVRKGDTVFIPNALKHFD